MLTYSQVKQDSEDMGVDLPWALERRKSYLTGEISLYTGEASNLISALAGKDSLNRELIFTWVKECNETIKKLEREMSLLKPVSNKSGKEITEDMITRAKEYPIKNLLPNPVRNNLTNCISHSDKTPSMSIKNNRVYCFSCGFKGSVIDVAMQLNGVDFKTAVRELGGM